MLPHDKVIWSRKCTSKMVTSIAPLQEKVCNQTAWIRVLLVMGSTLTYHTLIFSYFFMLSVHLFSNHTVVGIPVLFNQSVA